MGEEKFRQEIQNEMDLFHRWERGGDFQQVQEQQRRVYKEYIRMRSQTSVRFG